MKFGRLARSAFLRDVFGLSLATAAGQGIAALATPVLARVYIPSDFGVLAAFSAIAASTLVVASLRYEMAIPIERGAANARHLLVSALGINALVAMLCCPIIYFFGPLLSRRMGVPELAVYLWLVPVFVTAAGAYRAYSFAAIRQRQFGLVSATRIWQAIAGTGFQLVGGVLALGSLGLISGYLIGQGAGVLSLMRGGESPRRLWNSGVNRLRLLALLKRHRRFPVYDVPAAAANTIGLQLPSLLMAALFGVTVAGHFAVGQRLLGVPSALIGQTVGQVLLGNAREQCENGTIMSRFRRVVAGLALVGFSIALVMFFAAVPLFKWGLGARWETAGHFAGWIALGAGAQLVYSPISVLLLATEGQLTNLAIQLIMLIARTAAILYGYLRHDAVLAVMGVSLAAAIGYLLATCWVAVHVGVYARKRRERLGGRALAVNRPNRPPGECEGP